jgi:transposase
MHKVNLTRSELKKLKKIKQETTEKRIFRRLQCVELAVEGKEYKEIADIAGVCVDTITDWIKLFSSQGLEGLCQLNFKGKRQSKIDEHLEKIKADIGKNMISTLAELQDWLKKHYEIEMEKSWLFRCCKKNSICLARKRA